MGNYFYNQWEISMKYAITTNSLPIIKKIGKLFFRTSFFGLIIAVCQIYLAYEQYETSKLAYSPVFIFRSELTYDNSTKTYNNNNLTIYNMGFPINNYDATLNSYLIITEDKRTGPKSKRSITLPIIYYNGTYKYSGGKDELQKFIGINNNILLANLDRALSSYNQKMGFTAPSYSPEYIKTVKISYSDTEGNTHTKYFIDNKPSTEKQVMELASKANNRIPFNLEDLTVDSIIDLFNKKPHQ